MVCQQKASKFIYAGVQNIYSVTYLNELRIDVESVRKGIGSDSRIGYSFIYPGVGYGGSCFPKDVKAIIYTAKKAGVEPIVLDAVEKRNQHQKNHLNVNKSKQK